MGREHHVHLPALRDWLDRTVRVSRIVGMILKNPMVSVFLDVTPGAREIVILSAVVGHLDNFDQVIVDMPASGHAVGMLKIPDTAHRLMRTGPIHDRAGEIMAVLRGPDTAMGIVALPEEMVVNETVELYENLGEILPDLKVPLVFLNRCAAPTMTDDEHKLLARLQPHPTCRTRRKNCCWPGAGMRASSVRLQTLWAACTSRSALPLFPFLAWECLVAFREDPSR